MNNSTQVLPNNKSTRSVSIKQAAKSKNKKSRFSFAKILGRTAWTLLIIFTSVLITVVLIERNQIREDACANNTISFVHNIFSCKNLESANGEPLDFAINTSEDTSPEIINNSFDVAAIYEEAFESVVGVGISDGNFTSQDSVIGSGFIISKDGLIATNQHVVSDQSVSYFVRLPGTNEIVNVVEIFRDANNDIAVLRVERNDLKPLTLGNSNELTPGELVIAIGNPLGELDSTVTSGIVSGLKRTVETGSGSFLRSNIHKFEDTIQTDAAINPGNSGGPLLNKSGEVVGINFATIAGADNLSFAIPISYLRTRLNELSEFGKFRIPYLGIEYSTQSYILNDEIIVGAEVISIDPSSAAVGVLQEGDVIIEFAETDLDDKTLFSLIQESEIGETKNTKVIRNRQIVDVQVTIGERD